MGFFNAAIFKDHQLWTAQETCQIAYCHHGWWNGPFHGPVQPVIIPKWNNHTPFYFVDFFLAFAIILFLFGGFEKIKKSKMADPRRNYDLCFRGEFRSAWDTNHSRWPISYIIAFITTLGVQKSLSRQRTHDGLLITFFFLFLETLYRIP